MEMVGTLELDACSIELSWLGLWIVKHIIQTYLLT